MTSFAPAYLSVRRFLILAAILPGALLLIACGQTGALYLPEDAAAQQGAEAEDFSVEADPETAAKPSDSSHH